MLLALFLLAGAAADPEPAIDRLARAVVEQAGRTAPEAPVAVWVEAPTPVLARAFASVLSAQLGVRKWSAVVLEAPNAAAAERSARERDLRTLIRVTLSAENTRLVARGDVLHTWVNFWAGATPTRTGGPAAALAATVDADAAAMTLASAVVPNVTSAAAPLRLTLGLLARLPAPAAAIAIGDLDGDKRPEIVVLTDDELLAFSPDGRSLARYDLRSLPPASRPGREPFGALSIQAGKVVWLSGRRAHGEALAIAGGVAKATGPADEAALDGVTVRLVPGINAFAAEANWFGKPVALPAPLTATNTRAGLTLFLFANGTGAITRGVPPSTVFSQAPSAAVLADLDGDGIIELLSTSARFFPDSDEVRVLPAAAVEAIAARAGSLGEATPVWSGATPRGRILAAAAGDLDGDGAEDVVLGAWLPDGTGELWVAKRSAP